jgi:CTP:molybdopterin cytidylyltransferase MocA
MKRNGKDGRTVALILAESSSERMGKCKVLLRLSRVSALEQITTRVRDSGVSDIIVVTGGHAGMVKAEANRLGCTAVFNPAFEAGTFSGIVVGARAIPSYAESFFLIPVDTPLVKTFTYRVLINAFYESYDSPDIARPTFDGERGATMLIGRAMIAPILKWQGERGMRGLLDEHPHRSVDVPTGDRAILLGMNTPEDYKDLRRYVKCEEFPDEGECVELLKLARSPDRVVRHMWVVASCAMRIADALEESGRKLNRRMLFSACLLHDIAKGEKYHEARGARWLRKRGYAKVAKLVASHKDLSPRKEIGEAEVLYLSDKITDGEVVSSLASRMARMLERFPPDSESLTIACRRIDNAARIQRRIEDITGRSLDDILA